MEYNGWYNNTEKFLEGGFSFLEKAHQKYLTMKECPDNWVQFKFCKEGEILNAHHVVKRLKSGELHIIQDVRTVENERFKAWKVRRKYFIYDKKKCENVCVKIEYFIIDSFGFWEHRDGVEWA